MTENDLIAQIKMAEQAERYDDMVAFVHQYIEANFTITPEVRDYISVAYKNVIGAKRSAWRIIQSIEQKYNTADNAHSAGLASSYCSIIADELNSGCQQLLQLIDEKLLPTAQEDNEALTFLFKMRGDYYRYLVEVSRGDRRATLSQHAFDAYSKATEIAQELSKTHPTRLGLALNFSVYFYELCNDPQRACQLAKKAFDEAISELDALKEDNYKDSTLIMQLLRDNLTLWTSENEEDPQEE